EPLQLAAGARQAEEELSLRLRGPQLHQAPALEDVVLDEGPDPPPGVGDQSDALVGVELLHGLHQADVPLLDEVGHLDSVRAILVGDLYDEAQVAGDELVRGVEVPILRVEPGEALLLVDRQQRISVDLRQVHRERTGARRVGGCPLPALDGASIWGSSPTRSRTRWQRRSGRATCSSGWIRRTAPGRARRR